VTPSWMWITAAACPLLASVIPQGARADPVHRHCALRPWSTSGPRIRVVDLGTGNPFTIEAIDLVVPEPPSVPNCSYETSDIITFRVELDYNPRNSPTGMLPIFGDVTGVNDRTGQAFEPEGGGENIIFRPGQSVLFRFTPHTDGVAFHVRPGDQFRLSIANIPNTRRPDLGPISITAMVLGTHYFVPEPNAFMLIGAGGLALLVFRCRRRDAMR
jgi:hypothetical protein